MHLVVLQNINTSVSLVSCLVATRMPVCEIMGLSECPIGNPDVNMVELKFYPNFNDMQMAWEALEQVAIPIKLPI